MEKNHSYPVGSPQAKFSELVGHALENGNVHVYHDDEPDNLIEKSAEYHLTGTDATVFATWIMFKHVVQGPSPELGIDEEEQRLGIEMYGGMLDDDHPVLELTMDAKSGEFTKKSLIDEFDSDAVKSEEGVNKILRAIYEWRQDGKLRAAEL